MSNSLLPDLPPLPSALRRAARVFYNAGFQLYLVGGAVRSLLSGRIPEDYDLATDAVPQEVMKLFRRVIPTGVRHGTVTVLFNGYQFEITTFRTESTYSDARRPDKVHFGVDIETDLSRRDFTINGMALHVLDGTLLDPFGGREDLQRGIVRAIGDPSRRFREDALRVLRAVRFATQLDFDIAQQTRAALFGQGASLRAIAAERIRDELNKMLLADRPSYGLALLRDAELLTAVIPELHACIGVPSGTVADSGFDVFAHLLECCDLMRPRELELRLAALLHDIGKPMCFTRNSDGTISFPEHAQRSAELAHQALGRLRYPNATVSAVSHLIARHSLHYGADWSDAAVRRLISEAGTKYVYGLIDLRRADQVTKRHTRDAELLDALRARVSATLARGDPITTRDLAVNGDDLAEVGIARGPQMGALLERLLSDVLQDPKRNQRDWLLERAQELNRFGSWP